MKKSIFFLIVFISTYGYTQTLPLDFETATTWTDFNGGVVTTIPNPQNNTDNNSASVGQMVKNAGEVWGGSHTTLTAAMDFANNNTFSMKVYSIKAGTKVLLKVENSGDSNIKYEQELTMSMTNAWETLVFDYSGINTSNSYDRIVIIFDNGTMGDGSANFTFYMDDITLYQVAPTCASGSTGNTPTGSTYELVWADEFNVDGAPCSLNWGYDLGAGGWGNGEVQEYTNTANNVIVEGGALKIKAKKDGGNYTSARLKSENKYDFKYGKVEVRAKLPAAQGTWPAIWMLGANFSTVGWPVCGEIDIMEQTGANKNEVLGTLHWDNNGSNASYGLTTSITNAATEYHTYSLEWSPDDVKIFLDGVEYYVLTNNSGLPFNANFFLILNVAMGGTLGGSIDPAFTEDMMEVDYVRVYQRVETTNPTEPTVAAPTPAHQAANVISMFSDAYTDVPVDTWSTNWSVSDFADVTIAGDPTKKYTNLGFNGIETVNPGPALDLTTAGMNYLHMDIWTPNSTEFKVKLVDFLGDGYQGANGDTEAELIFTPTIGQWHSLHIPLADFTTAGMTSMTNITQLIITSAPYQASTVFVDNVYYTSEAVLSNSQVEITDFKVLSNPTKSHWMIRGNQELITRIYVYDLLGKKVAQLAPNAIEATIDATSLKGGLYIAKIKTALGTGTVKLIKE
jgi:beta-glucanase (GH16 family)